MDSNLKTSYERMEEKKTKQYCNNSIEVERALITKHAAEGRFYSNSDYLISYVYVNF